MTSEGYRALGDGKTPERLVGSGVDEQVLVARQIRLYIENTPDYVLLGVSIALVFVMLWPLVPDEHLKLVLWAAAFFGTLFARFAAWVAFTRANPKDDATRSWLKWFLAPHVCGLSVVGIGPILFLPASSGHDVELVIGLGAFVAVGMLVASLNAAAYRPLVPLVVVPILAISAVGLLKLPGALPKLIALATAVIGLFAYRLAGKLNRAFVRSMELSIRNEQLVAALQARTAQLQQQTLALQQQTLVAEEARRVAERAERDKTRFIAAASHDLRQPMHAISLLVGMLQLRTSGVERETMERLERSVEAMDKLFSAILDLSKLDSGAVQPSIAEIPLRAILDPIEVHFAPQAATKRLALDVFRSRAIVRTDRVLLERVLRNFVSNAIKYTDKGRVLVGCRRRGDRLALGVWDTGAGIAAENLEHIFDEYFQIGGVPRDRSAGLGLGLSIVRRLARLLGSEARVTSRLGRGSWFGVEIPLVGYLPVAAHSGGDHSAADTPLQGKFILIVDDEADVRFGAEALLREWGCHTAAAASVEEVGARLEGELRFPDAIVTDYRLGTQETGLEVIEAVRQYTCERTPAVILTGEDLGTDELSAAGTVYPVIKKPLSADELRRHLVAALGRADASA